MICTILDDPATVPFFLIYKKRYNYTKNYKLTKLKVFILDTRYMINIIVQYCLITDIYLYMLADKNV